MAAKRQPLVAFADVERRYFERMSSRGLTIDQILALPPVLVQTRISRVEKGRSSSPERQVGDTADWCVDYGFRPVFHVGEETSGSIFRRRRRTKFEQLYDDIINDRLIDPATGQKIVAIVCWMYDRFTRDPDEGGMFIKAMLAHGIDLYETHFDAPPQPLYQAQSEIRRGWVRASQEVEGSREKIMTELRRKAEKGIPTFGVDGLFGHERFPDKNGTTAGYHADPVIAKVAQDLARKVIAGTSEYSVVCWLNENGYRNAHGNKWTMANVQRFLRAPRLAGLIRLRSDSRRIYEPDYEGDLYPAELMYEEGEEPDLDFVAPIEPLMSYPLWFELQETLEARETKRGPYATYFASGRITCPACGSGLTGAGDHYHCPKRHLDGIFREKGVPGQIAHDGKRHPTMKIVAVDMFLEELLFAIVAREFDPDNPELVAQREAKIAQLDQRLMELEEERANLAHLLKLRQIKRAAYDADFDRNQEEMAETLRERRKFAGADRAKFLPRNKTLRDLWPAMPMHARQEWLDIVFDQILLHPSSDGKALAVGDRFEVTFNDGYAPPRRELEALTRAIQEKVIATHGRKSAYNRMEREVEEKVWALYDDEELPPSAIHSALVADPDPRVATRGWTTSNIIRLLHRLCDERGVEYVSRSPDAWRVDREVRELMVDLYRRLRGWAAVARELNALGLRRPGGGEWTSEYVRRTAVRHAELEGFTLPRPKGAQRGRSPHLNEAMRQQLWKMHYKDGMSYPAIARWLTERGIKTASGKSEWSKATVQYVVQQVERERKQLSRKRAA
jgi:hypothetical protein